MAALRNAHYAGALVALQFVFLAVVAGVTSTKLDTSQGCYLNLLGGSVCDFAYVTAGMCGLFALLLGVGVFLTLRQPDNTPGVFLPAIYGSLGLFTASWWLVAAITFTIRGDQASDDGLPYGSDRNAVIAFSWLSAIDAFFVFVLVVHDRVKFRQWRYAQDRSRSVLDLEEQEEFKKAYVATQALGATPVV